MQCSHCALSAACCMLHSVISAKSTQLHSVHSAQSVLSCSFCSQCTVHNSAERGWDGHDGNSSTADGAQRAFEVLPGTGSTSSSALDHPARAAVHVRRATRVARSRASGPRRGRRARRLHRSRASAAVRRCRFYERTPKGPCSKGNAHPPTGLGFSPKAPKSADARFRITVPSLHPLFGAGADRGTCSTLPLGRLGFLSAENRSTNRERNRQQTLGGLARALVSVLVLMTLRCALPLLAGSTYLLYARLHPHSRRFSLGISRQPAHAGDRFEPL